MENGESASGHLRSIQGISKTLENVNSEISSFIESMKREVEEKKRQQEEEERKAARPKEPTIEEITTETEPQELDSPQPKIEEVDERAPTTSNSEFGKISFLGIDPVCFLKVDPPNQ